MKNPKAVAIFMAAALEKVKRADAIGSKTSWSTEDHNRCLAQVLAQADIAPGKDAEEVFYAIVADAYNVSQFQQDLEKIERFSSQGHFQRKSGKVKTPSAYEAFLDAQL